MTGPNEMDMTKSFSDSARDKSAPQPAAVVDANALLDDEALTVLTDLETDLKPHIKNSTATTAGLAVPGQTAKSEPAAEMPEDKNPETEDKDAQKEQEKKQEQARQERDQAYLNPDNADYAGYDDAGPGGVPETGGGLSGYGPGAMVGMAGYGLGDRFNEAGFGPGDTAGDTAGFGVGDDKPPAVTARQSKYFDQKSMNLIRGNPGMVLMLNRPGMMAKYGPALPRVEALLEKVEKNLADDPKYYDQGVVEVSHGVTRTATNFSNGLAVVMKTLADTNPQKYPNITSGGIRFVSGKKQAAQAKEQLAGARGQQPSSPDLLS